ncbi:TonB family protein [Silvimonas sp.]|uniref:TonB family protein n=1 Tax=Silvimonas sp. TaxID=2650811 RepID=UPI00284F72ED|nr:TonB family protein [Silvimonas sp.]MDR3426199.1 TonB family protein [Silvimonas sp.]
MSVKYISFKDGVLTIQLDLLALAFLLAILLHLSALLIPKGKTKPLEQAQAQQMPFQMQLVPKQTKAPQVAEITAPPVMTAPAATAKPDYVAPPPKPRRKVVKQVASAPAPTKPDQDSKDIQMSGLDAALNHQPQGQAQQQPGKLAMHFSDLKQPIGDPHDSQVDEATRSLEADPLTRNIFGLWEQQIKQKVERIGQMNFPKDKNGNSIFGLLQFRMVLNSDGTLAQAKIVNTSGNPELDAEALKILRYSAPFGPVPKELLDDHQQITLVRYYQFINLGDRTKWSR